MWELFLFKAVIIESPDANQPDTFCISWFVNLSLPDYRMVGMERNKQHNQILQNATDKSEISRNNATNKYKYSLKC